VATGFSDLNEAEFNEVFLDDVKLDGDAVVGGVGNGWGTAMTVLMFERLTIGFGSESFGSPARLAETVAGDAVARADSETRHRTLDGSVAFVPDLDGAGLLVAVAVGPDAAPAAVALAADAPGVRIEPVRSYDFTRRLAHVQFSGARGQRLDVGLEALGDAWYLSHALIAAESIGATQTCLDRSVAYAKERFTFGRAIGSYQAAAR
jgi:alkylation response protein AidB-like acyl-CoA dehydrogenase